MIKIGAYRIFFGIIFLLVGIWNYNLDTHIDCHKYSSGPMDEQACNSFQDNYYYDIKSIPIGLGIVSIIFSFVNPREIHSRPYFENEKTLNYYGLQSDVQMFGYLCKCGHYRHDHDVGVFTIITLGKSMGKCETCLCPKYRANRKLDRNNKPEKENQRQ